MVKQYTCNIQWPKFSQSSMRYHVFATSIKVLVKIIVTSLNWNLMRSNLLGVSNVSLRSHRRWVSYALKTFPRDSLFTRELVHTDLAVRIYLNDTITIRPRTMGCHSSVGWQWNNKTIKQNNLQWSMYPSKQQKKLIMWTWKGMMTRMLSIVYKKDTSIKLVK